MRIATYNVENLFKRAKALNLPDWKQGVSVLDDCNKLNCFIQDKTYTNTIKSELIRIIGKYPGLTTNNNNEFILLRKLRGQLLYRPKNCPVQVVANGRDDWVGWFELKLEAITETSSDNTARIIEQVKADVMCVVEADDRIGLKRFNELILPRVGGAPYRHTMLIDGNDDRGIDVGLMAREGYEISGMRSHVDEMDKGEYIFSRDCAEYEIKLKDNNTLVLLLNHFKSKIGKPAVSDAKRLLQAGRVREIYDAHIKAGRTLVAILGDFNSPPGHHSLAPLTGSGSPLVDIMQHNKFQGDGYTGTWGAGKPDDKFDYILMSPELAKRVTGGGVNRKGIWAGKVGQQFSPLPTIKSEKDAASDHAALWADIDL